MPSMDVLIVGAGPSGLACAIACSLGGLSVHLADAIEPPIDKACGEGLLPEAIEALASLGIHLDDRSSHPLEGIRFLDGDGVTAESVFQQHARGVRRTVLHQLLVDRAVATGVKLHWKHTVQGIDQSSEGIFVRTNHGIFHPRYLVGADGHHSRVASAAGLDRSHVHSRRIGLRQHYARAPWSKCVEVYWSREGQAYVTPVSGDELCVAFVSRHKMESPAHALALYPELRARLDDAEPASRPRGGVTLHRTLSKVAAGHIALVGDASGSVDAVTGMGLSLSFRQAVALASAIRGDDLPAYTREHHRIQRPAIMMSRALLLLDRSAALRTFTIRTFRRYPKLFQGLLELHSGQVRPRVAGPHDLTMPGLRLAPTSLRHLHESPPLQR